MLDLLCLHTQYNCQWYTEFKDDFREGSSRIYQWYRHQRIWSKGRIGDSQPVYTVSTITECLAAFHVEMTKPTEQ